LLYDKVLKYHDKSYDYNCAETMLYAANDEYQINLSKQTMKSMAAFGGGMGIESVCGAITGSLAVLSIMFTIERGHESDRVKNLSIEFFQKFTNELGSDNCAILKQKYKRDDIGCNIMLEAAANILEEIVLREQSL